MSALERKVDQMLAMMAEPRVWVPVEVLGEAAACYRCRCGIAKQAHERACRKCRSEERSPTVTCGAAKASTHAPDGTLRSGERTCARPAGHGGVHESADGIGWWQEVVERKVRP